MPTLSGSETEQCLKKAFAHESQAHRRYMYFAAQADIEGRSDIASLFRSAADGESGHANGHLEFLQAAGDPMTGLPFGQTHSNLLAALEGEKQESEEMYPEMARIARAEGFAEIADWFETLAKAERSHAVRYTKALEQFSNEA